MSNVLIAVDLSEESHQVLSRGKELAQFYQVPLKVMHVAENPLSAYSSFEFAMPLYSETEARDALKPRLFELAETHGIITADCLLAFGKPAVEIHGYAQEQGTQLIVVGSHGRHGVGLLLGSTANAVVHGAGCDVFAVRIKE